MVGDSETRDEEFCGSEGAQPPKFLKIHYRQVHACVFSPTLYLYPTSMILLVIVLNTFCFYLFLSSIIYLTELAF